LYIYTFYTLIVIFTLRYNILIPGATKTPYEGALTSINAAVNPLLAGVRDVYYDNCRPKRIKAAARFLIYI